ncbi:MAG: TolC family protein [Wenzhouxiangella sp.]|nr:MAG: TolC family protein [Wenzhouxiangella sp.]
MLIRSACCSLCLLGALCLPASAEALPVEAAVERALSRDAGLKELAERARALDHQAVADRALPDPELSLGAEGLPINDPFSSDMMTMYRIGISQRFPAGDSLALAGQQTTVRARAIDAEARARAIDVALQTRLAWLDWVAAGESSELVATMVDRLGELVSLTERRFAAGTGRLQDETQARLELALMERRRLDALTEVDETRSRLQRWTGAWAESTAPTALPDWPPPPARPDSLERQIAAHPELDAARLRRDAGEVGTELARQAYRPMWMIEAGYGHQRGSDPMGGRMSDKLYAMATISLPLFAGNRQDRRLDAALAERDAEEAGMERVTQRLTGALAEQLATQERLSERRELLEQRILPHAREAVEATRSAYQSDQASFDELIRAQLRELELELDLVDTRRRLLASTARITSLTSEETS